MLNNLGMSSVSTISHEEIPQCFSVNDVIIKRIYRILNFLNSLLVEGGVFYMIQQCTKLLYTG